MTATITSISKVGTRSWKYTWDGTPPFEVWESDTGDMLFEARDLNTLIVQNSDASEPPALEIRDATDSLKPSRTRRFSRRATLQFRGDTRFTNYLIEQKIASVWTFRRIIREAGEGGYYQYNADVDAGTEQTSAPHVHTTEQFRVTARWRNEISGTTWESTPLNFDLFIVGHPPPPTVTITYNDATDELDIVDR